MKSVSFPRYSQERQVLMQTFAVTGVLLILLGLLVSVQSHLLSAASERMTQVSTEIHAIRAEFGIPYPDLVLAKEQMRREGLKREWETLRLRTNTFRRGSPLSEARSPDEEGRIDFKVALFGARARLQQTASSNNIAFPADLGMEGTIGTDEHAETRLWQLASVVKLMEECFRLGIPNINSIRTMPPVEYPLLEEEDAIAQEFPVDIRLNCSYRTLEAFLHAMSGERCFFSLRQFWLENEDTDAASLLTVDMVCGAILFRLRGEDDAVIYPGGEARNE